MEQEAKKPKKGFPYFYVASFLAAPGLIVEGLTMTDAYRHASPEVQRSLDGAESIAKWLIVVALVVLFIKVVASWPSKKTPKKQDGAVAAAPAS